MKIGILFWTSKLADWSLLDKSNTLILFFLQYFVYNQMFDDLLNIKQNPAKVN